MAAFGSLTLSWPGVWAHHGCCLTWSANSDIPTLFNFQPVPQPLLLTRRRRSIASFGRSKPTREVFQWIFWHLFNLFRSTSRHRVYLQSSKFKLRFHLDAFGDHEHSASGCGHAKRRCLKTDTTRFQTAPWQELYCPWLDILWPPLLHQRCLWMLCTPSEIRRQGWRVESTMGVWQCRKNRSKAKMKAAVGYDVACIDVQICGWTLDLYILVILFQ